MILAQTIETIPAAYWKYFCLALFALIVVAGVLVSIYSTIRKPAPVQLRDEPPITVAKASKRFTHDLAESRHVEISRRVDGHYAEIEQLWNTMRDQDADLAKSIAANQAEIMRALGRLEGRIK